MGVSKQDKQASRLVRAQQGLDDYNARFEGPVVPLTPETAKEAAYRTSVIGTIVGGIWWPLGWKQSRKQARAAELIWAAMTPEQRRENHRVTMNFGQGGGS